MTTPHEVFGNYDYEFAAARKRKLAAERKLNPNYSEGPRLLGRVARLLFTESTITQVKEGFGIIRDWWKRERAAEKAERAYRGSLNEIRGSFEPDQKAYVDKLPQRSPGASLIDRQPHPHPHEPGVYYSEYATVIPDLPEAPDDELLRESTKRARQKLGQLPVAHALNEESNLREHAELPMREPGHAITDNPIPAQRTPDDENSGQTNYPLGTPELQALYSQAPGSHRRDRESRKRHPDITAGRHRVASAHPLPFRLPGSRKKQIDENK